MSVKPSKQPLTYEAYAVLPEDGRRWELIDGDLEVNPAPSPRHQTVSRRLQFELMRALEEPGRALVFEGPSTSSSRRIKCCSRIWRSFAPTVRR
jgi:hypothetical protein